MNPPLPGVTTGEPTHDKGHAEENLTGKSGSGLKRPRESA